MADPNPDEMSILESTKKLLNVPESYTVFDLDIMTHINSVFFVLHQLDVGPAGGFMITGKDEKWSDFIGPSKIQAVKTYMALKVRLLFDPPATSFTIDAFTKLATEIEWRLNLHTDTEGISDP